MTEKSLKKLKKLNNLFLFIFFIIFVLQLIGLFVMFLLTPIYVEAQVTFTPRVTVPGSDFEQGAPYTEKGEGLLIAEYIQAWYKFAIAGVGILAVVMIMAGGLVWLTAGGRANQISTAKDWIMGAVAGLVLALMSYTLLDILNPNLVTFESLKIADIDNVVLDGCIFEDICAKDEKEIPNNCGPVKEENKEKKCCCSNRGECFSISPALCESYSNCKKMSTNKGDKCAYKKGPNCFIYSSIDTCNNDNNCKWSYVSGYCLEKEVKEGCVGEGTTANGSGCFLNTKKHLDIWKQKPSRDPPNLPENGPAELGFEPFVDDWPAYQGPSFQIN